MFSQDVPVIELAALIAALIGAAVGGVIGARRGHRVSVAIKTVKAMRAAFHKLDVAYAPPSEQDNAIIAKLDASPLLPTLKASWRLVGDRVFYRDGASTDSAVRIFLDGSGTIVAALIQLPKVRAAPCYMYSFTQDAEYWTLPHAYRGLALGPHSRTAAVESTAGFETLLKRHREVVREVTDLLTMTSADDVVAEWKRFFQQSVEWRDSREEMALFEADALSLAGGSQPIAKRIAKRIKGELTSVRVMPPKK